MPELFRPILLMTLPSIAIKTHPAPPLGSFSLKIFFASKHWPSNSLDRLTCQTNWTARKVAISNLAKGNPVQGVDMGGCNEFKINSLHPDRFFSHLYSGLGVLAINPSLAHIILYRVD